MLNKKEYKRCLNLIYLLTKHNKTIIFLDPLDFYKTFVLKNIFNKKKPISNRLNFKLNKFKIQKLFEEYAQQYFKQNFFKTNFNLLIQKKYYNFIHKYLSLDFKKKKLKKKELYQLIPKNWIFLYPEFLGFLGNKEKFPPYKFNVLYQQLKKLKRFLNYKFSFFFYNFYMNFQVKADLYVFLSFNRTNSKSVFLLNEIQKLFKPTIFNLELTSIFSNNLITDFFYYTNKSSFQRQNFFFVSLFRLLLKKTY